MRRDTTCNVSIATEHPLMTEEANLKASYHPGRSGGTFGLPLGAKLIVPEGLCGKKESITCRVAPPSQRWSHNASFPEEHVTSEIFSLSANFSLKQPKSPLPSRRGQRRPPDPNPPAKRTVILILPYFKPEGNLLELNVKGLWKDETSWVDVGFIHKDDAATPCVELELDRLGTFVVTYRSKTDQFQMTPNGGLFHSRLDRHISVRFPKKAIDTSISFQLQIVPIPDDILSFSKEYFPQECQDLLVVSEFIDLRPDTQCNFRRNSTVKLPLPAGVEVEGDKSTEVVVLHKAGGGEKKGQWEWVEGSYKFTRNTVSFDVKNPNKFCIVKSKPERHKKMQEAVTVLEQRLGKEMGEVSVFLSLKEKSWMVVVECYPLHLSHDKLCCRQGQGFTVVHKASADQQPTSAPPPRTSFSRRPPPPPPPKDSYLKSMESFELFDGLTWRVEVKDEVKVTPESDLQQNAELQCFRFLKESYRQFWIQPAVDDMRALKGTVTLTPVWVDDLALKEKLTLVFPLDIPEAAVVDYHFRPEPQPEPEKVEDKEKQEVEAPPTPKPAPPQRRGFSASAMERLTQHTRRGNIPEKESRVISGKSLMALSKVVNEGLTLAVHLDLPESTITGIGFDALSNNRGMSDVAYKILLHWKRTRKGDRRDGAVQHLCDGLRSMGRYSVADIVQQRHRENKELSLDCFVQAAVQGVDISA